MVTAGVLILGNYRPMLKCFTNFLLFSHSILLCVWSYSLAFYCTNARNFEGDSRCCLFFE